jgi:hypothetical protein
VHQPHRDVHRDADHERGIEARVMAQMV